jgi:type I restriction enzyme, S subunit
MIWPSARLDDLCEVITKGTTPTTLGFDFSDEGVPFLRVQNIDGGSVNYESDTLFIDDRTHQALKRSQIRSGDVLVSIAGTIGRAAVVPEDAPLLNCNQAIAIIRTNGSMFRPFLRHWLESPAAQMQMRGATVTGTISNLSLTQVGNLRVQFPPFEEQRRIATILDQTEALRSKRRDALAQLDKLIQAIFIDLFGDPRRNERKWPTCRIGSVISGMRGGANLEPEDFVDSGFPILHKGAIKPNGGIILDLKKKTFTRPEYAAANRRCQVDRGFLAVTLRDLIPTGPSIGLAVNLQDGPYDEYLLAQGAYGFLLDPGRVLPEYFVYLSNVPNFRHVLRKYSVGSTQIHIRIPVYLDIAIPIPPLELQREFACRIAGVERIKRTHQGWLLQLEELFFSVQEHAFTGALLRKGRR